MKRFQNLLAVAFVGLLAACGGESATGEMSVTVLDLCADNAAIEGAQILQDGQVVATTDASGVATLAELDEGDVTVTVKATGYLPEDHTAAIVAGETDEDSVVLECQSSAVASHLRTMIAPVYAGEQPFVTKADALFAEIGDSAAPAIIDFRRAEDYETAHIPGAINMGLANVASDEAAATLMGMSGLENGYVSYCYSAHTAGIAAGVMSALGYPTRNMKGGFVTWNQAYGSPMSFGAEYEPELTVNEPTETYPLPVMDFEATDALEATVAAAQDYLANRLEIVISGADLAARITDGDAPFIVDVRAPADYEAGHIPGAINIPWKTMLDPENLAKLPPDQEIVLYCYAGMSAGFTTGLLGVLGYDVVNLKAGYPSWNSPADYDYYGENAFHDYAIEGTDAQ